MPGNPALMGVLASYIIPLPPNRNDDIDQGKLKENLGKLGNQPARRQDNCRAVLIQIEKEQDHHGIDERAEKQEPAVSEQDQQTADKVTSCSEIDDSGWFLIHLQVTNLQNVPCDQHIGKGCENCQSDCNPQGAALVRV
jgi:hypothetical protein